MTGCTNASPECIRDATRYVIEREYPRARKLPSGTRRSRCPARGRRWARAFVRAPTASVCPAGREHRPQWAPQHQRIPTWTGCKRAGVVNFHRSRQPLDGSPGRLARPDRTGGAASKRGQHLLLSARDLDLMRSRSDAISTWAQARPVPGGELATTRLDSLTWRWAPTTASKR